MQHFRIHHLPAECGSAFQWLTDTCKKSNATVSDLVFTSNDAGAFVSAEGTICIGSRTLRFMLSDYDCYGSVTVHIVSKVDGRRYPVFHSKNSNTPLYPLEKMLRSDPMDQLAMQMQGLMDA